MKKRRNMLFWLLPSALLGLATLMIAYPQASWESGVAGLAIWWEVLFPSLFPFFVISELMLGFGIVHFLGKLLDPLMRPLFGIPGSGGFVAAMGFASGYPVSAKLATKLREQRLISRVEGERLVAFTTSSDPIFLIGAVSVGFFGNSKLASVLALAHYGSALLLGLIMKQYRPKEKNSPELPPEPQLQSQSSNISTDTTATGITAKGATTASGPEAATIQSFSLKLAFQAMHQARIQDGRSLGELLKQAISSSLQLMTVVGGLVVFFSVILELLKSSGTMTLFYQALEFLLAATSLPTELAEAFVGGLFEVTLGAKASASAGAHIPLIYKAAAAAFVLSWGGLSVHAQVVSILNDSDLRYAPFLAARLIHGILASLCLLLLWQPIMGTANVAWSHQFILNPTPGWVAVPGSLMLLLKIMGSLLLLSLLVRSIIRLLTWLDKRTPK